MATHSPGRSRTRAKTADNYIVEIGEQVWSPDNLTTALTITSFPDGSDTSGLVIVDGGITIHLCLHFFFKRNALFERRRIIEKKLMHKDPNDDQALLVQELQRIDNVLYGE